MEGIIQWDRRDLHSRSDEAAIPLTAAQELTAAQQTASKDNRPRPEYRPIDAGTQTDVIEPPPNFNVSRSYRDDFPQDPSLVRSPPPMSPLSDYSPPDVEQFPEVTPLNLDEGLLDQPPDQPIDTTVEPPLIPNVAQLEDVPVPSSALSSIGGIENFSTPLPELDFSQTSPYQTPSPSPESSTSYTSSVLSDVPDNISDVFFDASDSFDDISDSSEGISNLSGGISDVPDKNFLKHDYDGPEGHKVLRLKPTLDQWGDFPAILAFARDRGADDDGCFKVILPEELQEPLPEKHSKNVPANAYKPRQIKKSTFWRVDTVPSEGTFASSVTGPEYTASAMEALDLLKKMYRKSNSKQIRNVRYRVDVPAWTAEQRREAGVPERSPIYPLKGDKLDDTLAVIPGIHTPYVYESGPYFGASFQIHAEDFRLVSLNHLYKGRKIWVVVPSTAVDIAEEALGRQGKCSQFMRHRAEFFFPQKLDKLGIPFRVVDQRPGETIVILPDAYHEGFSTGYTIAEAKNYADAEWSTDRYQPCEAECQLVTAIPAELMRPLKAGEVRLDLCTDFETIMDPIIEPAKRRLDDNELENRDTKRRKIKRVKG
ncbi:Fc.00g017010.m01.CDS01 [Cosmosporella sp. VM-42]